MVLCAAMLGGSPGGGGGGGGSGGGVEAFGLGSGGFGRHGGVRVSQFGFGRGDAMGGGSVVAAAVSAASTAVGRHFAVFALWPGGTRLTPPFAALAASHLRLDPDTGLIEEMPESEIVEDILKFHVPVQHPGGPPPTR